MRVFAVAFLLVVTDGVAACGEDPTVEPDATPTCDDQTCSGHGSCAETDVGVACTCEAPWAGARCDRCQDGWHLASVDACAEDVPCEPFSCSGNGICDDALGVPSCACSPGYAGAACDVCADGYHVIADGRCVVDASCAEADPCGPHGTCSDEGGVFACACAEGWTGERCDACAEGYHADAGDCVADEVCAGDTCSGFGHCAVMDGLTRCTCASGHGGLACERCEPGYHEDAYGRCPVDRSCFLQNPCGPFATCLDADGELSCACAPGYAGWVCRACAPGYHLEPNGFCTVDSACRETTCAGGGSCSVGEGGLACACADGYTGSRCESCAGGYHREGRFGPCVADTACATLDCGAHGACEDGDGRAVCRCDAGYDGAVCDACAVGYHVEDGACLADARCAETTCAGTSSCADTDGGPICACTGGRTGVHCEICALGFHPDDAGGCALDAVCDGASCSGRGSCLVVDGRARCDCDYTFGGDACEGCAPGFVPVDEAASSCVYAP
ncbi:MAG: hypothetical protein EP329_23675 [Deltaproteobacteria bacterium]|nr:MAG: hypothetical protein EP329_23675 [Deltaproteobacteria bacterium]